MAQKQHTPATGWARLDRAAFGIVYGSIMVLSVLIAAGHHPQEPFQTAVVIFGSILAITLAKAFAELMAHALETGERVTRKSWKDAWRHSSPTLTVANLPALFFILAGFEWMTVYQASMLSQITAIALLSFLGTRVGWVIEQRVIPAILGGIFFGSIGLALGVLKFLIH